MRNQLPEKARTGLTWRRLRNAAQKPFRLLRNIKFWWGDTVSDEQHIFVMGPPRSGTTLVKTVLQSHPNICGVDGETWFFHRKDYAGFRHPNVSDQDMRRFVQKADSITGLFDYFATAVKKKTDCIHFLEKTPEHALRLSYLVEHFPQSTFIFLVRDPRDGLRSARGHSGYWSSLPTQDQTGGYIETWRQSVETYKTYEGVSSVLLVRYEDFCRQPDEELRRVLGHIGLEMDPDQLDPSAYGAGHEEKVDAHARLREPITPKSVGRWRNELSEDDVQRVERTLVKEMRALGYSPEYLDVE